MAKNACSTKNFDEAITHINKIHEYDLQNFEAWRIKAIALCGKLLVIFSDRRDNETLRDLFTAESLILCWKNALTSPQITNKTFAENKIFDDFVQNYLALLYGFIKTQKESSEPLLRNHADRLIFLFKGLNLIFQTPELQYFKNKIPKFTPRYSAQLINFAKSENDKMRAALGKVNSRANHLEDSFLSFLRFYEINRLRDSENVLKEKIQNNEQVIEKLRAEQDRLADKNLLKLKAKLRGVLNDASKIYPEFGKWSREIAEYK